MLFPTLNQQCQSTEGNLHTSPPKTIYDIPTFMLTGFTEMASTFPEEINITDESSMFSIRGHVSGPG